VRHSIRLLLFSKILDCHEKLARDKHFSFSCSSVSDEGKKVFLTLAPGGKGVIERSKSVKKYE
jgi:hypothetical protein